jgi:hypothetical protein
MLPVETELHLRLKVAGERLCFNDLAAWGSAVGKELSLELVRQLIWQIQVAHADEVLAGKAEVTCGRCGVVHSGDGVVRRGSRQRKIRTTSGVIEFRLVQLTCRDCGATWSPYPNLLGLEPRCRVSEELLRQLFESVVQVSYAKTAHLAKNWLGSTVSSRTLHRAVQRRAAQVRFTEGEGLHTIVADGSMVKAGPKKRGEEYCVSFQIQERAQLHGRPAVKKRVIGFGFGRWGWYEAFSNETEPKLVVTDGEQGIRQCVVANYTSARHQLCEWHVPYTLSFLMTMDGGTPLKRRKRMVAELREIIRRGDHTRYTRFIRRLKPRSHARIHLERAQPYIMFRRRSKVRTTSWAERQMRELNRRTDVGVRWSPNGVANMIKLRLAILHNQDDYERIWTPPNPLAFSLVSQG